MANLNLTGRDVIRFIACCGILMKTSAMLTANGFAAESSAQRVAAHLNAGEFGVALSIAQSLTDPAQQAELVQSVARAQQAAGEPVTARLLRPARSAQQFISGAGLSGAGANADFFTLIGLIEQNTSGPWLEPDGLGGASSPYPYGVHVNARGMMLRQSSEEHQTMLSSLGLQARQADLNVDVAKRSDLRLVSLTRLEHAVTRRLSEGESITETMAQMAGLSQIKHILIFPESREIVIGGPAEGWQYNPQGQPVGILSQRPTLQLDDLVTLLRVFNGGDEEFGCSIETREAGVKALVSFVRKTGGGPIRSTGNWSSQLQEKLGKQDIRFWGVPADSRVARVIVEADYRMKLIGIDKAKAVKEIPSYFDLVSAQPKGAGSMDALRWWLTMNYESIAHSSDRTIFEIRGSSVRCLSENEYLTGDGKHYSSNRTEPANRAFADLFTAHYDKLSARDPVFADLQNVFDLALVSALICHEELDRKAHWAFGSFASRGGYNPARFVVPKEVDSVVNYRVYDGRDVVVQVAGGVRGNLMSVVKDVKRTPESPRLGSLARIAQAPELPEGRWWWDAARSADPANSAR